MNEQETNEENSQENSTENSGEGNNQKAGGLIDGANAAAERLEIANKKQEELLNRQEEIIAKQMLSGRSEAGAHPIKKKEESPKEYHERIKKELAEGKTDFN